MRGETGKNALKKNQKISNNNDHFPQSVYLKIIITVNILKTVHYLCKQ
jgi:hypothetical protein